MLGMSAMTIPLPQRRRVPRDSFALRLVMLRHDLDWTQQEAADTVGVKRASWASWEKGRMPHAQAQITKQIADATGYDLRWLLYGEVSDSPTGGDHPTGRLVVRVHPQEQNTRRLRPGRVGRKQPFRVIQPAA